MTENTDNGTQAPTSTEKATFAAGCFWKPESFYREMDGVVDTAVGYEGGHVDNPTYEMVCSGTTGHAEVVQVEFDPEKVSYEQLVDKFWKIHDPTQVNRQGPDIGDQYRTSIFTHSDDQAEVARRSLDREQANHKKPIATLIEPATGFWMAEEYHQCYLEKRAGSGGMLSSLFGR